METLASRCLELRPLDVELLTLARLAQQHHTVLGFRYPTQGCPAMVPAAMECAMCPNDERSRLPVLWCDQGRQPLRSSLQWNNGENQLESMLSVIAFAPNLGDSKRPPKEIADIIEVRYPSQLVHAIGQMAPALGLVHLLRRPDPKIMQNMVAESRRTKSGLLIVYSPGAALVTNDLRDLGVPSWIVPRASLSSLNRLQATGGNIPSEGSVESRWVASLADEGWSINALALTDDQMNWSLVALWRELATLSSVAAPRTDLKLDIALSRLYGLLVAAETQSSPTAISDSIANRTLWAVPFSRRDELARQALADLAIEHQDLLARITYVEQLYKIVLARLRDGNVGRPASILQLVVKALSFKRPLLIVTCSEISAKATAAFLNLRLEKLGLPTENGWEVVSAAELMRPNLSMIFRRVRFTGGRGEMACLPMCRHEDHAFLYGLPLARMVVTFLYHSQVKLYRRILERVAQDDMKRVVADYSVLLKSWELRTPIAQGHQINASNITMGRLPSFREGTIPPIVRFSDVASQVAEKMRAEFEEEGLVMNIESRGAADTVPPDSAASHSSDSMVDALTITLDGGFYVYATANHRVFIVHEGEHDVLPILTREVQTGDHLIAISGSVEYSLTRRLLHELADLPDWSYQVRYRLLWVETLQEWMEKTGSTPGDFLVALKKRNSAIRTEEAIRFWLDGDVVIGPRDSQDILRTAEICGSKKLARYADVVITSIEELREVHQQVKNAVIEGALQGRYHQIESGTHGTMPFDTEARIEQFVKDVAVYTVTSIGGPVRIESRRLNVIRV